MQTRTNNDRVIAARLPGALASAVSAAAQAQFMPASAFIRQAIAEKLTRDGFTGNNRSTSPIPEEQKA